MEFHSRISDHFNQLNFISDKSFYLIKIYNTKEDFELIEFKGGEKLVYKFLSFYQKDIDKYFPDYVYGENANNLKFVVLRDLVFANIFVARLDNNANAFAELNYKVPELP